MKLAAGAGLWPAFWALGDGRWPDTGEIDVMENVGDAAWISVGAPWSGLLRRHAAGETRAVHRRHDATAWHVYSVDWTPDALVFRVDKREVYRVTRAMVESHGRWAVRQSQAPDPRTWRLAATIRPA